MVKKSMKSRRRKNIHKDFQKVKLKVGRTLTLTTGLNVTDASFSSRKILIREQLGNSDGDGPKSHRQISISVLLSQLEHYNSNIRRDAVLGLQQVVQSLLAPPTNDDATPTKDVQTPSPLHRYLGPLLTRGSALVVDRDTTVRQVALRLFQTLLTNLSQRHLSPFFKLIIVHVCCAMTHIEEQIQLDSLKFVDLLAEQYPQLVAEHSAELVPKFIGLIARRVQGENVKSTLAINPGLKVHARRWRKDVLDRLFAVLKVVYDDVGESANQGAVTGDVINVDGVTSVYRPIREKLGRSDFRFSVDQMSNHGNVLTHARKLEEFADRLLPLIQQSWMECTVAVNQSSDVDDTLLPTMASVTRVTALVCRCIHGNETILRMASKYGLVHHFMSTFPYDIRQKNKKNKVKVEKISMVTLNLEICEIVCHLETRDCVTTCWQKVMEYISSLESVKLEAENIDSLMRIFRLVLSGGNLEVDKHMVDLLCRLYTRKQLRANHRPQLHDVMIRYVLNNQRLASEECVIAWMQTLPDHLVSAGHTPLVRRSAAVAPLVSIMALLAPRNQAAFLGSLQEKLCDMIDVVLNTPLAPSEQRRFVELLYYTTSLRSRKVSRKLLQFCNSKYVTRDVVVYLINVLDSKMSRQRGHGGVADTYFSLLLSLCLVGSDVTTGEHGGTSDNIDYVKIVSEKLQEFPNYKQIFSLTLIFLQKYRKRPNTTTNTKTSLAFLNIFAAILSRRNRTRKSRENLSLKEELDAKDDEISLVCDILMDVLLSENESYDEGVWVPVLSYDDVYSLCMDRLKENMALESSLTLDRLQQIITADALKQNAMKYREKIEDIISNDIHSAGHTTILRNINYQLAKLA